MIVTLGLRALQIVFCAIILALSVVLINGTGGKSASQTDFASFCGGFGLVIAAIGIVACFLEALQGIIMAAIDGLAAFFILAAGIAFAATLGIHSCTNPDYTAYNKIIQIDSANTINSALDALTARCHEAGAVTAFLFFAFVCFAGTMILGLLSKSGGRGSIV